jgi:phosphocarrier protein FPr/phosphocarrier protein
MLVAVGERLRSVADGATLLLEPGALTYAPDAGALGSARERLERAAIRRAAALACAHEPAITRDGTRIEVFANLASADEARAAVAQGAEGCGLLRTEFLFIDRSEAPSLAEQHGAYGEIAAALGGRPLIVRTLDIGADKPAPYLPTTAEENPALGLRGIRLQLAMPDLLDAQLRALVRVDVAGSLRIMLPMVSELSELRTVRAALARIAAEDARPCPELGIMIETPAAALHAGVLAAEADFFSIGSNDLAQYTLARDRTNPQVAAGLDALHPAVLHLIEATAAGGARHGRWTGICGGLGADPDAIPLLIGLGISELSVSPAALAETKARVRELDIAHCRALAEQALEMDDARAVRALVRDQVEEPA